MGVDIRKGKQDYYTRYRVYRANADITDKLVIDKDCIGILHAKDITAYNTNADALGGKFQRDTTRATIETMDRIEIGVDYFLFAIAEQCWYRVESVAPNSHNETQRWSARPVNTTTINIVRTN